MKSYRIVYPGKKYRLSKDQIKMLDALKDTEPQLDEECPELTDEELAKMRTFAEYMRERRRKQVLTLRVTQETMDKAKSLGKGYTGILSRLLELALNDPEMVKKAL